MAARAAAGPAQPTTPHRDREHTAAESDPVATADDLIPRCAVCLEPYNDRAVLDGCFHAFCLDCITTWARQARSCPLCKAEFDTVIHTIVSNTEYATTTFGPLPTTERQGAATLHRRVVRPTARRSTPGRTPWGDVAPSSAAASSRGAATVELRRAVYAERLVRNPTPRGRYKPRPLNPAMFSAAQGGLNRLVPWLKRELFVLIGANRDHQDFMLQLVCALLRKVGLDKHRAAVRAELEPFLLHNTSRFLDELASFAESPFDMVCYDQLVTYQGRSPPRSAHDVPESTGSHDSQRVSTVRSANGQAADATAVAATHTTAPTDRLDDNHARHERRRGKRRRDRQEEFEASSTLRTARLRTAAVAATSSAGFRSAMLAPGTGLTDGVPYKAHTSPSATDADDRLRTAAPITMEQAMTPMDSGHPGSAVVGERLSTGRDRSAAAPSEPTRDVGMSKTDTELKCRLAVIERRLAAARSRLQAVRAAKGQTV
eukprot:m.21557 g.21557  ORF g.21557 m.21557 type:complete len:487 (+) comp3905_c0_seq1:119-1579(+)